MMLRSFALLLFFMSPVTAQDASEAYDKAAGAYSAATGAAVLAGIDFDGDSLEIGVGVGNIAGHSALGIKLSYPLSENWRFGLGTFRTEDGVSGTVMSVTRGF